MSVYDSQLATHAKAISYGYTTTTKAFTALMLTRMGMESDS